jgi:hypothetical protein
MQQTAEELINDLIDRTKAVMNQAEFYYSLANESLNYKPGPDQWSILECFEHLNRYGDFYLPEISLRIRQAKTEDASVEFKSGWLGNYFAKSMLPRPQLNKMKTFKVMNPNGSNLEKDTIKKFIGQQKQMLQLLDAARRVNLNKVRTGISISKWIKLRLGDTFRVVIYHNQRHMAQANRVLKGTKEQSSYS